MTLSTDLLGWITVAFFITTALLRRTSDSNHHARFTGSVGFTMFAAFWGLLTPYYLFEMKSFVEGLLAIAAIPAFLYTAYLLYNGRDSLFVLIDTIAVMGFLFLATQTIPPVREFLIESVTQHALVLIHMFGFDPNVVAGPIYGYQSAFEFFDETGHRYITYIEFACTGIGSISLVAGLILGVPGDRRVKLWFLAIAIPSIYLLNLFRNAFIAAGFAGQWFQIFVPEIMAMTGYTDPRMVSFFIADRVLSQLLSVLTLLAISIPMIRHLPGLGIIVQDVVFILTGVEYDIEELLNS